MDAGEVSDGQQEEQDGQRTEDHLGSTVVLQGADEHEQGEDAPQQQIEAQCHRACSFNAGEGIDPDQHQGPPEQTVGCKCSAAEGVTLL